MIDSLKYTRPLQWNLDLECVRDRCGLDILDVGFFFCRKKNRNAICLPIFLGELDLLHRAVARFA